MVDFISDFKSGSLFGQTEYNFVKEDIENGTTF
jgi:hypothetical protein